MHLLAGPRQHGLICLGEPGTARGENKKQTGKSRGGTLGMWHRAHRDVPSGASQDPQPKNTVRHPDTDLCLLSVPSWEGDLGRGAWRRAGSRHCQAWGSGGATLLEAVARGWKAWILEILSTPWSWVYHPHGADHTPRAAGARAANPAPRRPRVPAALSPLVWWCRPRLTQRAARHRHGGEKRHPQMQAGT